MKRYKILAMGVILAFLFGNTAIMAAPAIKKQAGSAASPAKTAASSLVQTASKIEVKNLTAPVGKDITLEARLITSKGELLGGKMIDFKVNGKAIGSAPTAGTGTANAGTAKAPFHVSGDYPPGTYKIEARFAGDATAGWGTGKGDLTVVKSKTKIELQLDESRVSAVIGAITFVKGSLINVSNPSSWINDRLVTLRSDRNAYVETVKTYNHGNIQGHVKIPLDLAPPTSFDPKKPFTVEAEFSGDAYFEPFKQTFTFYSHPQPPPKIEGATLQVPSRGWLKLTGKEFKPSFLDADWMLWLQEYKNNWVQVFADDGKGIKKVPFSRNDAHQVSMTEILLDVSGLDLRSCQFKVVREKSESNIYTFSYANAPDPKALIKATPKKLK
jgi:hypothetical protein